MLIAHIPRIGATFLIYTLKKKIHLDSNLIVSNFFIFWGSWSYLLFHSENCQNAKRDIAISDTVKVDQWSLMENQ